MERWKIRTCLEEFKRACEEDAPHDIIRSAKKLRKIFEKGTTPAMAKELVEELFPLLDDRRVYVRQCAACILLREKINEQSYMPFKLPMVVPLDGTFYTRIWTRKIEPGAHETEWQTFVKSYRAELQDRDVSP